MDYHAIHRALPNDGLSVLVGAGAKLQRYHQSEKTIASIQRLYGRINDEVATETSQVSYDVVQSHDGTAGVDMIDRKIMLHRQISGHGAAENEGRPPRSTWWLKSTEAVVRFRLTSTMRSVGYPGNGLKLPVLEC